MFRVRGMGVADRVSTSTCLDSSLSFSLWATPKRCSSSTTSSPRSFHSTSFWNSRWVPMSTSMLPSFTRRRVCFIWAGVRKRETTSISTGYLAKRCLAVKKCWRASTVVGTRMAACLPSSTHFITARKATSVLP